MSNEDVVIEYFRSAREEVLFRTKHRDDWFKLALLAQAVLWGLGKGVKIGGAEPLAPMPEMLNLALPVAYVFAGLYYVEDGLCIRLSKYIRTLSVYGPIASHNDEIRNLDASTQLKSYAQGPTLLLRIFAQLAAFLALPVLLATDQFTRSLPYYELAFAALALILIFLGYVQRWIKAIETAPPRTDSKT